MNAVSGDSTMAQVLEIFPGARRALFRRYHIGGCASCGFQPEETLGGVCERNGGLPVAEVLDHIASSHRADLELLVEPRALAAELATPGGPRLLDIRPRDEWETARLEGSELLTQALVQEILVSGDRERAVVVIDHAGTQGLDAAAYLAGHGLTRVRALRGGLDAWAQEVDPSMPRYRIET